MAFEIPAHLKKEQPSSATPDGLSGLSADPASASASPSAASEHIRSLLAPLLAEDWPSLSARQVGGHRQRLELDAQATKVRPNLSLTLLSSNSFCALFERDRSELNQVLDTPLSVHVFADGRTQVDWRQLCVRRDTT